MGGDLPSAGTGRAVTYCLGPYELGAPELPRRARRHSEQIAFVERIEPPSAELEDLDAGRLVIRFQGDEQAAFLVKLFESLPLYQRRAQPFRAWLFAIVRNHALDQLRRNSKLVVTDVAEINSRRGDEPSGDELPVALGWLSDRDVPVFVERLPEAQRQVLFMRGMLDLDLTGLQIVRINRSDGCRAAND